MAALSNACLFQGVSIRSLASHGQVVPVYSSSKKFKASLMGDFRSSNVRDPIKWMRSSQRNVKRFPSVKFARKDGQFDPLSVEPPPYHSYMDSTSGQLEPASGARASIPGKEYWPEGTAERVRAARTPEPVGKSETKPSYGKKPGSRRKRYKAHATASENSEVIVNVSAELDSRNGIDAGFDLNGNINKDNEDDFSLPEASGSVESLNESKEPSDEYVIYQVEEPENLSPYEMDKKIGRPHPFLDPSKVRPIEEPQTSEDLWWNWRKPEEGRWSRWQRRRPDVDTVFAKAMAETGQIKLYGEQPTLAEAALARARKEVFKEERLQAERRRLEEIGPIAYYSEWVKAWTKDTSREAVQKHFEETGEDENTQLITMFQHQTAEEFRIMMGTDVRIQRDPLAMRMREELIKEIWGGDPVYPTINYIQDPDEVIDYRGPNFHEPTPDIVDFLMEHGKMISREELNEILAKEKKQDVEVTDIDEAMASAVDIGENDDEDREDDENGEEYEKEYEEHVEEKISRNWSVLKTTPQPGKSTENPKVNGPMSLQQAIDDSENLTDFLMDFDEDE